MRTLPAAAAAAAAAAVLVVVLVRLVSGVPDLWSCSWVTPASACLETVTSCMTQQRAGCPALALVMAVFKPLAVVKKERESLQSNSSLQEHQWVVVLVEVVVVAAAAAAAATAAAAAMALTVVPTAAEPGRQGWVRAHPRLRVRATRRSVALETLLRRAAAAVVLVLAVLRCLLPAVISQLLIAAVVLFSLCPMSSSSSSRQLLLLAAAACCCTSQCQQGWWAWWAAAATATATLDSSNCHRQRHPIPHLMTLLTPLVAARPSALLLLLPRTSCHHHL
jgi:hypothetical protein